MTTPISKNDHDMEPTASHDSFEIHRQMVVSLFLATVFLCLVLAVAFIFSSITALMTVIAAGALGGFVSALRRLYTFQRIFPSDLFKNWPRKLNLYLVVYSMIPPLVGAIAAVAIYLIFAAGLLKGGMFPEFHLSLCNPQPNDFYNFVHNWQPVLPSDYAKAIVWAFIAGFSERFVPDILERLSSKVTNEKKE